MKFKIAIGKNRNSKNWKNIAVTWEDLCAKLTVTHRTSETFNEYVLDTKDRQAEIKDVGGFVGGHLLNGRRKKGNILFRSIIALDLDYATADIWDEFKFSYKEAAAIYTTHKHSPESPRYRLVIPLNRTVLVDEYEAIARKIASYIGIDYFDPTTFQAIRLMYWPSTSRDGEFFADTQDGPFMDADAVLASYDNWKDLTQWPLCKREKEVIHTGMSKAGNPLEKEGLIGGFCQSYTIQTAIETFLSDVYVPCDVENRYTYTGGSTGAGLVVYDDMYAFSHHSTDPAEGRLCNAFDLVRIHKFNQLDEGIDPDTPTIKRPSFREMLDFAGKDANVCKLMAKHKLERAVSDFAGINAVQLQSDNDPFGLSVEGGADWTEKLERDKKGEIKQSIFNSVVILENDPNLNSCLLFDDFSKRKCIVKNLPWRSIRNDMEHWVDEDDSALRLYMEKSYGLTSRLAISDALSTHLLSRSFHPVRDYLDSLSWDGIPRLDRLFVKYLGAKASKYIYAITRKTLVAAVARIYNPGVKFDYVLTIAGAEGTGKSTIIKKLGGDWFTDNFTTIVGTAAKEQIQGHWLIEMGEMSALRRAEVFAVKQFISSQEDSYRPAYGRHTIHRKRQCIFFATTNEMEFLRGVDGNRRFWIVDCHGRRGSSDIFALDSLGDYERNQVWAEAKFYFSEGEELCLSPALEEVARREQKKHGEFDDRTGLIQEYLDTAVPKDWYDLSPFERRAWLESEDSIRERGVFLRDSICIPEIWCECLKLNIKDLNPFTGRDLNAIMKSFTDWELSTRKERFKVYGTQRAYYRTSIKTKVGAQIKSAKGAENESAGKEIRT